MTGGIPQRCAPAACPSALTSSTPRAVRLQVGCVQLGDSNPYRVHWPMGATLHVNRTQLRAYGRQSHVRLGPNQRDEPIDVSSFAAAGRNHVQLVANDDRINCWVALVRWARPRSLAGVKVGGCVRVGGGG